MATSISTFIVIIIVAAVVIFITREVWNWYFRINEIVKQHDETNRLLRNILKELESKE